MFSSLQYRSCGFILFPHLATVEFELGQLFNLGLGQGHLHIVVSSCELGPDLLAGCGVKLGVAVAEVDASYDALEKCTSTAFFDANLLLKAGSMVLARLVVNSMIPG